MLRIASRTCPSTSQSIMPDLSTSLRFRHEAAAFEGFLPGVRSFLVESQRRVIEHCGRLLTAQDLAAEHRHRLTRLVRIVENELPEVQAHSLASQSGLEAGRGVQATSAEASALTVIGG